MKRRLVALVLAGTLIFGNSAYAEEAVTGNPIAEDTVGSAIEDPFDESIVEDSEAAGSGSFDEGIIENCESADVNSSDEDTDALVDEDTDAPEDGILFEEAEVDTISREDGGLIVDLQPDTVSIEDHSDFDADQALMQYLNSTFQAKPAPHKPARIARREKKDLLGEKEKVVYDQILPQVKEIVNGNKTDSHIEIDYTKFPGYKDRFYESDLGCTLVDQGEITDAAQNALTEITSYDLGLTVDALRYDHPELFFWYGRASASGGNGLSISGGYDYDKNAYYLTLPEPAGILDMSLSAAYRAAGSDPYAIDSAKMTAINTAKSTVKTIISSASGERDLEKMKTYLKEIDERITYNHDAANNSGNIKAGESDYSPWEIIYVFDGDPKTNVVCEGYSKAFKYLCDQSTFTNKTISTYIVTGTLSSGTGAGPHMWNIVRINGKSYLVDPTNCDQDDDAKDIHTYSLKQFMVGAEKQDDGSWKVSWGIQPLEGSKYQIPAGWAGYTYDGETKALYDESELTLSSTDYVEGPTDDHVHTWSDWKVTKAATCTETGTKTRTCSRCSETETEEIPALGHDWGEYKVTKAATCTETGTRTRTCSRCSEAETEEIPAKGHQWNTEKTIDKDATCTEAGQKSIHCSVDDVIKPDSEEEIPALGHDWGEYEVTKAATCTETGTKTRICSRCSETETEEIPAAGHQWNTEKTIDKEATCTEAGQKSIHCTVDDVIKPDSEEEIPALGHDWGEYKVTKAATCTETGTKTRTCSRCSETETEEIPAAGHQWNTEKTIDKEATCTEAGQKSIHCTVDDVIKPDSEEEIPALGHDWGEYEVTKAATCTETGTKTRICSRCSETETEEIPAAGHQWNTEKTIDKEATCTEAGQKSIHCTVDDVIKPDSEEEIPALGHDWGEYKVTKAATCTETGTKTRTCSRCSETETEEIPAKGHQWNTEKTIDKEATCTEAGQKSIHCSVDDVIKPDSEEEIPALGHDWGEYKVTKEATCTEPGEKTYTCNRCNKTKTEEIPALGHDWGEYEVTKAATCTEPGEKTYTCNRCNKTKTEEIPALGHDWGEYKVTKEATCTETGTRTRTCSRCSETEMEEIPAKGHQWNAGAVTKSSTCSQTGVRTYTCTVCGATRTESIPVNPDAHAWRNSWTVARQATVLSDGLLKDVCAYNSAHVRTRGTAKLDATATLNAYSVPLKTRQTSTAVKVTGLGKGDFVASAVSSDMKVVVAGVSGNSIFLKAGKKKGSARVLITMGSGITRVLQVKVQKKKVAAKKVSIQCSKKLVLNQGNTVSINADVMPITTKDKIKYSSSKKKVASVTRNGMITAKKKGKAVITVRCGRKKVKIKVTVR